MVSIFGFGATQRTAKGAGLPISRALPVRCPKPTRNDGREQAGHRGGRGTQLAIEPGSGFQRNPDSTPSDEGTRPAEAFHKLAVTETANASNTPAALAGSGENHTPAGERQAKGSLATSRRTAR